MSTMFVHIAVFIGVVLINVSISVKIGSFNTYSLASTPRASAVRGEIETIQLKELSSTENNIDILCLEELFFVSTAETYNNTLTAKYPYSFSELDTYDFLNLPRTPCLTEQVSLLNGCITTQCSERWNDGIGGFLECINEECQSDGFDLYYSDCIYCVALYPAFSPDGDDNPTLVNAINFCSGPGPYPTNIMDSTAIYSKYPIVNTWRMEIPSHAILQRAINIAEIDICELTSDGDDDSTNTYCVDTVIVACTHLEATDWNDPAAEWVPGTQEQVDLGVLDYVKANKFQIEFMINNIFNKDNIPWKDTKNNIKQVFVVGDLNVGNLINADNFNLLINNGSFIQARNLMNYDDIDGECTYCADPIDNDLQNEWAVDFCETLDCFLIDSDLDHILIYEYDINTIKPISYLREFKDLHNVGNETDVPLSDHWGISFEFEFEDSTDVANNLFIKYSYLISLLAAFLYK